MVTEKYVFFWNGVFSQWYPSKFVIEGVEYNCCEQYMMAQKALLFNDLESHKMIMYSKSPNEQKGFGRRVKGFDKYKWDAVCRQIVFDANMAKFTQNDKMLEELIKTGEREIVEASPYDKIWGIGLHETDARCLDKSQWQGTNWLGEAIMSVREKLR
jgi:ribA/ribD-fused uncharacterized protein